MALKDVLPDRPLKRTEVDALGESDRIYGIFPVYGDRPSRRDSAYAVVLSTESGTTSLAYAGGAWETVEQRDLDADEHGLSFSDQDELEEMQKIAAARVNEA